MPGLVPGIHVLEPQDQRKDVDGRDKPGHDDLRVWSEVMTYDLVVIGSGPGGYVCAIRAAQLGMKVAVVEKRETFGGTCLNIGCIPSKALLHASELFEEAGHTFEKMGIRLGAPKLDLPGMMKFKDEGVDGNVKGIAFLFKKNKIDAFLGTGKILAPGQVEVRTAEAKAQTIETKAIVIATGSDVARLNGIDIDEKRIVSSTGALSLDKVPQRLLVVGAGVIGLELGSVWRRLGSQVLVVEFLDRILPGIDAEVGKQFQRLLERQGMTFKLSSKLTAVDNSGKKLKAKIEPVSGGAAELVEADVVLVAIGRVPCSEGLGLEAAGVKRDNRGRVVVDRHFASSVPGIYAIGDVIAGPMLAHKAEDEGVAVAEILAGQAGHVNYDVIPNVVYTFPEIASVGKSEEELKEAGIAYRAGKFPFTANSRARVNLTPEGFVKILADAGTDRVLGVHIVGADAGNMIAEAAVAMEFGASSEDIARTCHAHPTLSEAVKEAALAVDKRSIHM
jgi:dihydrolipoamide dehydrogenase